MRGLILRLALAAACVGLGLPSAAAAKRTVQSRAADIDVGALAALTQKGDVALIESTPEGRCRQVVLFALLEAPPEKVWDVVMDVEAYPSFMKTVEGIRITGRRAGQFRYVWALDVPFFTLEGSRLQRGRRPSLVEVRGHDGHLRGTRERWELYPVEDGARTLAVLYRSLDVATGGLLLETMVDLEPSMDQGVNLSTGFVQMRQIAAHLAGKPALSGPTKARTGPVPPFRALDLQGGGLALDKLTGLLAHGQLALIESHADGSLKQVALFTEVKAPAARLKGIVQAPADYPKFIPNFARQDVTREKDGRLRMDWTLDLPISDVSGVSFMTIEADGSVDVQAHEGDISRGRWRWEFHPLDAGRTIPIHYVYSDVREASWVTRKIVEKQPLLEHGIVIASGTVALTAMKARAEGKR